ncbi:ATP-binding cassette domain-containing protein [Pleomorphovibrio marinus]|uniref:ATP-binding cassette domain-containing protein n=1 Tax=Pleomorphovibrio marinus TaxID=2164132 RepID=UPI000E0ADFDA|nr:ATP-binding cassette domain-containing protein [Pleomorphovibrio marinus]
MTGSNRQEKPFLTLSNASVNRRGKTIFQELTVEIKQGENWAILAGSGTEKTAFLETVLGRTSLVSGSITRHFARDYQEALSRKGEINSFRDLIAYVSQQYGFTNKSNIQEFYYQQRFNSMDAEDTHTVEQYLLQQNGNRPGYWDLENTLRTLNLTHLRDKSLIKLSNGETRRLAIAVGLLRNPKLFLMDRPMTGLDQETREQFGNLLAEICKSGIQVIMTTTPSEIPNCIQRVGHIRDGRLEVVGDLGQLHLSENGKPIPPRPLVKHLLGNYPTPKYQNLAAFNMVNIKYGDKTILEDFSWQVKPGERWLLKGHNGAGKSTLVSLLVGENPQAYANDLHLFDRKRGTGESIWDVKRPTGFVSPELSRFFPANQTCLKVVLSGLFDTMGLFKKTSPEQHSLALAWMEALSILHIKDLRIQQVSLEDQRFCLLARAMIKQPALLVLDEAAQGMDEEQRLLFKQIVEEICRNTSVGLIYVSHYADDVPGCVDKQITLENGRLKSKEEIY